MHSTCPAKYLEVKRVFKNIVHCLIVRYFCARIFRTFGDKFKADFSQLHPTYPGEQIELSQVSRKITFFRSFSGFSRMFLGCVFSELQFTYPEARFKQGKVRCF